MLAIVIPYYKLVFFDDTLRSLAAQTDKRFCAYIGDDASPDNPSELLEGYRGAFDFIYHKFETNLGGTSLVQQWNRCMAMAADEEWLMVLGDDDVLGSNCVAEFYKKLEEVPEANVIRFATVKIDDDSQKISGVYENPEIELSTDFLFSKSRSSLSEYIFRKKNVMEIGFKDFPLAWLSDVLAVLEFSLFSNIHSVNSAIVYVRTSALNISGRSDNLKLKAKAVFDFAYYLVTQKKQYFTKHQQRLLLRKLDKAYLNDKKQVGSFIKISKVYLKDFSIIGYLILIKSMIFNIYVLKKMRGRNMAF